MEGGFADLEPIAPMQLHLATDPVLIDPGAVGGAQIFHIDPAVLILGYLGVETGGGGVSTEHDIAFFSTDGDRGAV